MKTCLIFSIFPMLEQNDGMPALRICRCCHALDPHEI